MPTFEDLIIAVTGRITYEEDFTFPKQKEGLALKLRSEYLPKIRGLLALGDLSLSIDAEGDIKIEGSKGTSYVTQDKIILTTGLAAQSIGEGKDIEQHSTALDELFEARRPLSPLYYGIRLSRPLRFKEALPMQSLQAGYFATIANNLSLQVLPTDIEELRWYTSYRQGDFIDTFELETEPRELQIRYAREAKAEQFRSFKQFSTAAEVGSILQRMRLLLEPLIADPSKLRGIVFREKSGG